MSNIFTIIKKELRRFFTDKRMVMSFILPGVLIYILYSLMGSLMGNAFSADKDYVYNVYTTNMTNEYKVALNNPELKVNYLDTDKTLDEIKVELANDEVDLYIVFDENFNDLLLENKVPKVSIYFNSSSPESSEIYNHVYTTLFSMSSNVTFDFLVNMNPDEIYDTATSEDLSAMIITMMLPFLLLIFLFTGCVSISTESIAGEKERGTIATLLVTPTRRRDIAIGKIIALSITAMVSAVCSFIGVIASLPELMGGASGDGDLTLSMYGIDTYLGIFGVIVVTVILFTTLLSVVSTLAKNLKEASQWSSVLMVFVMMFGITSMMGMGNIPENPLLYLIPVYNSVQCMSGIFALSFNGVHFLVTIISNIAYIAIGIFVLARMFNSEKIMCSN